MKKQLKLLLLLGIMIIPTTMIYFLVAQFEIKPLTNDEIKQYHSLGNVVVVYPLFTQGAYASQGFYNYYNGTCDTKCLTIPIPKEIHPIFNVGKNGYMYLKQLGYEVITDVDVDHDPSILHKYSKVILLHNEYVTQTEFDAITSHPNVVYLYPNALYGKVISNYYNNTITLIRGHNYPTLAISNAFDWPYDNSKDESNLSCIDWKFTSTSNGIHLNCYPEILIGHDRQLLYQIQIS